MYRTGIQELKIHHGAPFFKSLVTFNFQFYLKCNWGTTLTAALSRLILSSHNLLIETGRWHRPPCIPREDRKCTTCNTIEDEYHFGIECSIFTDLRKRYISNYYWTNSSMYQFSRNNCLLSLSYIVISKYVLVTVKKQTVFFSKSIKQHINTFSVYGLTFHLFPFYL